MIPDKQHARLGLIAVWLFGLALIDCQVAHGQVRARFGTPQAAGPIQQDATRVISAAAVVVRGSPANPQPPAPHAFGPDLDEAIRSTLANHPELATIRQQHGIAAAGVVIARTYPYNPTLSARPLAVSGPADKNITNRVALQVAMQFPLEIRGQGKYRREQASAALSKTEWEVAFQETFFAVRTARAFHQVLYRQEKLRLLDEYVELNRQASEQVKKLVEQGKLRPSDFILARTEIDDVRSRQASARTALTVALGELRRSMGNVGELPAVAGSFQAVVPLETASLAEEAKDLRADLQVRQAALAESDAKVKLIVADRFGNPSIAPTYEYDQDRIHFIGAQFNVPLPMFNKKRGEILQAQAQRQRAFLELRQTEVQIQQDVETSLARLTKAKEWAQAYEKEILPNLRANLAAMEKLFLQGDPGADVLRMIDLRRKEWRAKDGQLDALWEIHQAHADLAASVGDVRLTGALTAGRPAPVELPRK